MLEGKERRKMAITANTSEILVSNQANRIYLNIEQKYLVLHAHYR